MNRMLSRPVRAAASLLLGAMLVPASILPVIAYNEENVQHVRLVAVDSIECGVPIELEATLTDREGDEVIGAQVNFTLKKGEPGDALGPSTDVSDTDGKAQTFLEMSASRGVRQVVASVPGGPQDQLTIPARSFPGCEGQPGGGGIILPLTGGILPATSTAEEVALVVARNLPIGAALAVAIGMLGLLYAMRRARGSRPSGTR